MQKYSFAVIIVVIIEETVALLYKFKLKLFQSIFVLSLKDTDYLVDNQNLGFIKRYKDLMKCMFTELSQVKIHSSSEV